VYNVRAGQEARELKSQVVGGEKRKLIRKGKVACNECIKRPHSFALPPLALSLLITTSTSAISFVPSSLDQALFNMARYMAQCLPIASPSPSLSRCDSLLDLVTLTTVSGLVPSPHSHLDLDHDPFVYDLDCICTQSTCALCRPPVHPPLNRCTLNFCTGHAKWSSPVLTGPRPPISVPSCQDRRPDRPRTRPKTGLETGPRPDHRISTNESNC
jgi:hypothetical protein